MLTPREVHELMSGDDAKEIDLSDASMEALRPIVQERMTTQELYSAIETLKTVDDARFPRGKWATIQHLESQL